MKVILVGANGAMGLTIQQLIAQSEHEIVAGFQDEVDGKSAFPEFDNFDNLLNAEIQADVIIDFSNAVLTESLIKFAVTSNLPIMLATTGQNDEQNQLIEKASENVAILNAHNTSIGVNIMQHAVAELTKKLYPLGYDIEIVEKHHRHKKDAPSGTANMLLDAVTENIPQEVNVNHGRSGMTGERERNDIGVHAIRGGDIVGEHTVIYANNQEVLEITHRAGSKELFAKGAITGAEFIAHARPGIYDMNDALEELQ